MLSIYTYTEIGGDMKSVRKIVDELQTTTAHHFLSFCRFPWYSGRQLLYAGILLHIMPSSEEAALSFVPKLCDSVHIARTTQYGWSTRRRIEWRDREKVRYMKRGPVWVGKLH